jgi:hypothetical protein
MEITLTLPLFHPSNKPVQLAKHLHKVPIKKRRFPAMASEKKDGVFAFGLPDGRIFSRTGKECFSLPHISYSLRKASKEALSIGFRTHVILFEVIVPGWSVESISGAFRRQSEQFTDAQAWIHDAIPYLDFRVGSCNVKYKHRECIAEAYATFMGRPFAKQFIVDHEEAARSCAEARIAAGQEGLILRDPDGTWTAGARNEYLVKIKQDETFDLKVIGIQPGGGKYKSTLGTLTVRFDGGTQNISGMSDEQRDAWWECPELILDKIVEVECMCVTTYGKMREPRFKRIRDDKFEGDY